MRTLILSLLCCAPLLAHAQGGRHVDNQALVTYPTTTVTLNFDIGTLGTLTNAEADQLVQEAMQFWNDVSTANIQLTQGNDLDFDVDVTNYDTIYLNTSDNLIPVIYDDDGSITAQLQGAIAGRQVAGLASSQFFLGTNDYVNGYLIINGAAEQSSSVPLPVETLKLIITHELGHLLGVDHSQLDKQAICPSRSNEFPLMYPVGNCRQDSPITLAANDAAALTSLYPASNMSSSYGEISGFLVDAGSGAGIKGANVWARNTDGDVFSVVSDFLEQDTGFFRLLVPQGTYELHVAAINPSFAGGSSVGPYTANAAADQTVPNVSFGSPPQPLLVSAGTAVRVSPFNSDGTGTFFVDQPMTISAISSGSGSSGGGGSGGGGGSISPAWLLLILMIAAITIRRSANGSIPGRQN